MRVLIYSESDEAKQLLESLREKGDAVSLRNPQYFKPSETETCDLVYTDSEEIAAAYESIEVKSLTKQKAAERVKKPEAKVDKPKGRKAK